MKIVEGEIAGFREEPEVDLGNRDDVEVKAT